ncbi:major facilitator superfamily domain-containing protein [Mycena rebaudengoi]|nr:major facilitator superfamily domain-containing protein [Mycena rebaudengoi]
MSSAHSSSDAEKLDNGLQDRNTTLATVDPTAERRLVRKLDIRLLPCLFLTYLLTFIDRSNAGNAKVAGLVTDLSLGNWGFNIGTCLYYVFYIVCETPAVMLVRRFGNRLVPAALFAFGAITIGTGFIHNKEGYYAVRCLLGVTESFVLPGNAYIITQFYKRSELSVRIGFFIFSAGYLSGAFGGLLASGFLRLAPLGSVHSWRHIFVWEGVITIAVGALLFFLYPTSPETTTMLTAEQRTLTALRMGVLPGEPIPVVNEFPSWAQTKQVLLNPVVVASGLFYLCNTITVTGLGIFTPTILALNYPDASPIRLQLLSVPPNVCAWAFSMLLIYVAMRHHLHGAAAITAALLTVAGYATWLASTSTSIKTRYTCLFLNTMGGAYGKCPPSNYTPLRVIIHIISYYIPGPIVLAWTVSNARTDSARALSGAMISGCGGFGSIVASWSYFPADAKTGYHIGNTLNVSLAVAVTVGIAALWVFEYSANKGGGGAKAEDDGTFKYVL